MRTKKYKRPKDIGYVISSEWPERFHVNHSSIRLHLIGLHYFVLQVKILAHQKLIKTKWKIKMCNLLFTNRISQVLFKIFFVFLPSYPLMSSYPMADPNRFSTTPLHTGVEVRLI